VATTQRVTKALPTECPECAGLGVTEATAPERLRETVGGKKRWVYAMNTRALFSRPLLGSGCPRCLGVGQLAP